MNRYLKAGFIVFCLVAVASLIIYFLDANQEYPVTLRYDSSASNLPKTAIYGMNELDHENISQSIKGQTPVVSTNKSGVVQLKKGAYVAVTSGSGFETTEQEFRVDGESELTVSAKYTEDRLRTLLQQQRGDLVSTIRQNLRIPTGYTISDGQLLGVGNWYITTLVRSTQSDIDRAEFTDIYRIVLQKKRDSWVLETKKPRLLLGIKEYPAIPQPILDAANNLE